MRGKTAAETPFFRSVLAPGGRMHGVFTEAELSTISEWIETGQDNRHHSSDLISLRRIASDREAPSGHGAAVDRHDFRELFHRLYTGSTCDHDGLESLVAAMLSEGGSDGPIASSADPFRYEPYDPARLRNRARAIRDLQGAKFDEHYASASLDIEALGALHRAAAPILLCDGVWLHGVLTAGVPGFPSRALGHIYFDELGSGSAGQNHARIYLDLMRALGILDHHPASIDFANDPRIPPQSFRFACLLMAMGRCTRRFFPEVLGFTLSVELEGLGSHYRFLTRELERHSVSALFYRVHVAADNLGSGHSHIAIEAIVRYIQAFTDLGADEAVIDRIWRRIWNGLVAFRALQQSLPQAG